MTYKIRVQAQTTPPENEFNAILHSLKTWGDCKIDPTASITYPITSSLGFNNEIIIQTPLKLNEKDLITLQTIIIKNLPTMEKIIFNDKLQPIVYKLKQNDLKWMATSTLTDSLKPLTLATLSTALNNENPKNNFLLTVGNEIINTYKQYPTPALILLILDKYADKDIPNTKTSTHQEITIDGLLLMLNILEHNLNITQSTIPTIEYIYKSLKEKNLLLHIPTIFNENYIKTITTTKLTKIFETLNKIIVTPEKEETKETPNTTLTLQKSTPINKFAHLTPYIKLLSTILDKQIKSDEAIAILLSTELIIPDCNIQVKIENTPINLAPQDFKYAYIDEEELSLILEDSIVLNNKEKNIIAEFLENDQPTFDKINIYHEHEQKLSSQIQGQVLLLEGA